MNLSGLEGGAHLHKQLEGPLAHAYILSGPQESGVRQLADIMARSLVCLGQGERPCNTCSACSKALKGVHPDIIYTGRESEGGKLKKEIVVAQVRQITTDAHTLPNEADCKIYIINQADSMNTSAQNAFLKMLEEPPAFCTFLLLAENHFALLPTVRSRCIHLQLIPKELTGCDNQQVQDFMKAFYADELDLLQFCVDLEKIDRTALSNFVDECYLRLTAELVPGNLESPTRLMTAVDLFGQLREDIRLNVGTGHISGKIAATLLQV